MKNKSSNEKIIIYLIIFFILFLVVFLVLYFLGVVGQKGPTVDVVLNKEIMIEYSKDKWSTIKEEDYSQYNWNKFNVYEDGKKKGKYSLYIDIEEGFYLFEEQKDKRIPVNATEESLFLGGKKKSQFKEFDKKEIEEKDKDYISSVLKDNMVGNKDYNTYIGSYKVIYDFDNDGENEEMYIISNIFSYNIQNTAYSLVFVKDGDTTRYIYRNIVGVNNRYSICSPSLLGIIKIDGLSRYQIITKCSYYNNIKDSEFGIYQNRLNTYELLLYIK